MLRALARLCLRLAGWKAVGTKPSAARYLILAAPHTSNWDFPLMIALRFAFSVEAHWLAKHSLFRPPFGWFFRALGGIPVDRRSRQDTVTQVSEKIRRSESFILALSPEGSRSWRPHWRSGFYHIAKEAEVPVCLAFLDFKRREGGFGPLIELGSTPEECLAEIRAFYETKEGLHPEKVGPICFQSGEGA